MGVLGAMSGGGQALQQIGMTGFESSMSEERAKRVAEYKAGLQEKQSDKAFEQQKGLIDYRAEKEGKSGPKLETINRGTEEVTGYFGGDGQFHEVASGPRWNPDSGGGKGSAQSKKYDEMVALGVPEPVARGVAYGTYKTVSDPATGATTIIDLAEGQEIGQLKMNDQGSFKWESMIKGQENDVPAVSMEQARAMAEEEANDKAGWFSSDSSDFGPGGREQWINNRAMEIMGQKPAGGQQDNGPVQVSSPAEAAQLPPGTEFITPDGQLRVKR